MEPLNKGHFGTSTKSKRLSFIERLSFFRRLYLLSFMYYKEFKTLGPDILSPLVKFFYVGKVSFIRVVL